MTRLNLLEPSPTNPVIAPITWKTYESLLDDLRETATIHLTYDQGSLEIMPPPLPIHEEYNLSLHDFIMVLSEELDLNTHPFGSTTLRRQDLQQGLEPDKCYYIQHEAYVRGARDHAEFDFTKMPPPDLVVEVDITHPSIKKLPLYRALGVPEVWLYDGNHLDIYYLHDQEYVNCNHSPTFAKLSLPSIIANFIKQRATLSYMAVLRRFRRWVKEQVRS